MNVYDPSHYITYVVLGADARPRATARPENRLPSGYANQSPRTSLRVRATASREVRPGVSALVS